MKQVDKQLWLRRAEMKLRFLLCLGALASVAFLVALLSGRHSSHPVSQLNPSPTPTPTQAEAKAPIKATPVKVVQPTTAPRPLPSTLALAGFGDWIEKFKKVGQAERAVVIAEGETIAKARREQ